MITFIHLSLNHSLAVIESGDHCIMLGTGCGNNGRMPGNARGSVEFVKLDVKVSSIYFFKLLAFFQFIGRAD